MVAQGADIIDIGGESTCPGASEVSLAEELKRVIPFIEYVAANHKVINDTSKAEVMRRAVAAGAHLINDVRVCMNLAPLKLRRVISTSMLKA